MITPIDVVDTAVKIGLGALISGLATYAVTVRGHRGELEKERLRRRRELLEAVATDVQSFSHALFKYWALVVELVRVRASGTDLEPERDEVFSQVREELFHAFGNLTSAEARLLLLGEKKPQKLLRELGEAARGFRGKAHRDNWDLNEDYLKEQRELLLKAREAFFDDLSTAYAHGAA
jgi:hypothetical protein